MGFPVLLQSARTLIQVAAVILGIQQNVFFLFFDFAAAIPLGFIEQTQAFHQQALRIQRGGLLLGFAFEVDLKISTGPA
jgi:hypothetical protein